MEILNSVGADVGAVTFGSRVAVSFPLLGANVLFPTVTFEDDTDGASVVESV